VTTTRPGAVVVLGHTLIMYIELITQVGMFTDTWGGEAMVEKSSAGTWHGDPGPMSLAFARPPAAPFGPASAVARRSTSAGGGGILVESRELVVDFGQVSGDTVGNAAPGWSHRVRAQSPTSTHTCFMVTT